MQPWTSPTRYYHSAVSPATKERVDRSMGSGIGAPWNVIVLNDNHNTFQGVAFALSSTLPGVSYDQGMALANRIHNTGRAIVWSGHQETAELYWEQLHGHGLTMAPLERV
jgi:ATP-dependent Clp protease adaptor protein ClpS